MFTVEEIIERLRVIETVLGSRYGGRVHFATVHIHTSGVSVSVFSYHPNGNIDKTFKGDNVEEALFKITTWLGTDEVAEINLTLGLTATGKLE